MARNYVEEQGGRIEVASEIGKGAVFTITLPECEHEAETPWARPGLEGLDAINVLVVEDNLEIARYIADGLKGMRCRVAHNGKSGYEQALQQQPDIIVSDIMMPVMNGEEMARIRQMVASRRALLKSAALKATERLAEEQQPSFELEYGRAFATDVGRREANLSKGKAADRHDRSGYDRLHLTVVFHQVFCGEIRQNAQGLYGKPESKIC